MSDASARRSSNATRSFAIVPAAGQSIRMGRPKLLLPWGEKTVIETVLDAWRQSDISHLVMTAREDDAELTALGRKAGAEIVVVSPAPADMKASVLAGLAYVEEKFQPRPDDIWLLAPADMPFISRQTIADLLAAWSERGPAEIVAPIRQGRRGHPVAFAWSLVAAAQRLGEKEGLNQLLARFPVKEVPVADDAGFVDLDTPEDYRRWQPPRFHPQ